MEGCLTPIGTVKSANDRAKELTTDRIEIERVENGYVATLIRSNMTRKTFIAGSIESMFERIVDEVKK